MATFDVGRVVFIVMFFFNDAATTEIYALSLHDALPISRSVRSRYHGRVMYMAQLPFTEEWRRQVNPDDLPLIVRARRRGFVFLLTVLVVMQFMAAGMYLNEVVQVHCCLIVDLGSAAPACNHAGGRTGK